MGYFFIYSFILLFIMEVAIAAIPITTTIILGKG